MPLTSTLALSQRCPQFRQGARRDGRGTGLRQSLLLLAWPSGDSWELTLGDRVVPAQRASQYLGVSYCGRASTGRGHPSTRGSLPVSAIRLDQGNHLDTFTGRRIFFRCARASCVLAGRTRNAAGLSAVNGCATCRIGDGNPRATQHEQQKNRRRDLHRLSSTPSGTTQGFSI